MIRQRDWRNTEKDRDTLRNRKIGRDTERQRRGSIS